MKKTDFDKLMQRDGGCVHCGEVEAVAPNHRINRGMGGVGKNSPLNLPSNLVVLCSQLNGLIESDHRWHGLALKQGWKLNRWDSTDTPFFHAMSNSWRMLDDDYSYTIVEREE